MDHTLHNKLGYIEQKWNEKDNIEDHYAINENMYIKIVEKIIVFYKEYYEEDEDKWLEIVRKLAGHFKKLGTEMNNMFEKYMPAESSDGSNASDDGTIDSGDEHKRGGGIKTSQNTSA